jgi:hypothetical protein
MTAVHTLSLGGRALNLRLSAAAAQALRAAPGPRVVEMELYFSCLIRKRVRVIDAPHPDALCAAVDDHLTVCFRPVMTRACAIDGQAPELESFPIRRPEAFTPRWLTLDIRAGNWSGEFGF